MNKLPLILLVLIATSCYQTLTIDGLDRAKWVQALDGCNSYRLDIVDLIEENQDVILEATQNEVESLLGQPEEHELYGRNQKFFHYRLTPNDSCGSYQSIKFLSIRFNAIGRANLVQVMLREPQ